MATEGGGGRRRAAEGGGGSSVDVLDVPIMCGRNSPSFPYNPTVGIGKRQKSRFLPLNPSAGGKNSPKNQSLETMSYRS